MNLCKGIKVQLSVTISYFIKLIAISTSVFMLLIPSVQSTEWPMSNDPKFDSSVKNPVYAFDQGPVILLDSAHHNFHVQEGFIAPFVKLANADGYRTVIGAKSFTTEYLSEYDIVMIITALPFAFTTKTEVTTETTFTAAEIEALYDWVEKGGSLLVFSEHAPFDQAINPLLNRFGIESSIGTIADPTHYDRNLGSEGWIVFSRENGLLDHKHPIVNGRNESESIDSVINFGGSSLSGEGYDNLFRLSATAENREHATGVKPVGMGNSQALAGNIGKGKVIAFADSNGFTAMNFNAKDGTFQSLGMNTTPYDWKQFVLNTLHWASGVIP